MTFGRRVIIAIAFLLLARPHSPAGHDSDAAVGRGPGGETRSGLGSATSLTEAQIEELTDNLGERREKLDYFYITAFAAILVFTFNNFNSRSGVLVKAPVWVVELGWGSLILAALCPLYAISARHERFALNMDWQVGKPFDERRFKLLRRRIENVYRAMTVFFLVGVGALCIAYALGLNEIKR